jgi:hypothetical protein
VLPLRRLQELAADGIVGRAATTHYSFIGYILQPRQLLTSTPVGMGEGVGLATRATGAPAHWRGIGEPPPWSVPPR